MRSLAESDYVAFAQFPLRWRFASSGAEPLLIRPLREGRVRELFEHALHVLREQWIRSSGATRLDAEDGALARSRLAELGLPEVLHYSHDDQLEFHWLSRGRP